MSTERAEDLLRDLAIAGKLLEIFPVGHIVQITVVLPLLILIRRFLVGLLPAPHRVLGEDGLPVQHGVDHHHDDDHHNDNGDQAVEQALD